MVVPNVGFTVQIDEGRIAEKIKGIVAQDMLAAGDEIIDAAVDLASYPLPHPNVPYGAPPPQVGVRTGLLRASHYRILDVVNGKVVLTVGNRAEYARFVHQGTYRTAARPWLLEAAKAVIARRYGISL